MPSSSPSVYEPSAAPDVLGELEKESRMGGAMDSETSAREVRRIDISDFARRKEEIAEQLWSASVDIGFFQVTHHGIPVEDIRAAFQRAEAFFDLPAETKALGGRDSLLSIVQMPPGIPVGTLAIGRAGAINAALLAAAVLALSDPELAGRLDDWREAQSASVAEYPVDQA